MSDAPPGPPARKEHTTSILVAVIGACGAIIAAAIPIVSSALNANKPPVASAPAASATENEITANNLADKSAYYITLMPYAASAGDSYTAVQGAYFRSPKDTKKWLRLIVTQHDHNKTVTLAGSDFAGKEDSDNLSADKAREGDRATVDTKNFKLTATVIEARTGADPDTAAPLSGKVFEKLLLRISCEDHS